MALKIDWNPRLYQEMTRDVPIDVLKMVAEISSYK